MDHSSTATTPYLKIVSIELIYLAKCYLFVPKDNSGKKCYLFQAEFVFFIRF